MSSRMSRNEILLNLFKLTEHDQKEVFEYLEQGVYFLGKSCMVTKSSTNFISYGYYKVTPGDHICYRYEVLKYLGRGANGIVVSAYDHKLKMKIAIKIMRRGEMYEEKFLDELKIYEYLDQCYKNEIPELGQMLGNFVFRGYGCIVLKKCYRDLQYVLNKNGCKGFRLQKVKKIVKAILKGLKCLHDVNLTHGDLKLDNIAFTKKNSSKFTILDLGNCKFGYQEFKMYDQCQYYRAPETILRLTQEPAVDMWALGCTCFELATGKILFEGETEDDQLYSIMEVLGVPPKTMIQASSVADKYFYHNNVPKKWCNEKKCRYNLRKANSFPWRNFLKVKDPFSKLRKQSPLIVDFITECLNFDVHRRMTVTEALAHKWLVKKRRQDI